MREHRAGTHESRVGVHSGGREATGALMQLGVGGGTDLGHEPGSFSR